jgi:Ser/Thr protein kinase RdoA (MazF antagonist)
MAGGARTAQSVLAEVPATSLPVVHSVIAADAVRTTLTKAYRFDRDLRCDLFLAGMNDTYLLTSNGKRHVARIYRAGWRSVDEISYEVQLLVHLQRQGVSVAAPVAASDGRYIHPLPASEGMRHLVVFEYATGISPSWTDAVHCYRAGRLLASLHAASDSFVSPNARTPLDLEYLIDAPLAAIRPFLSRRPDEWAYLEGFAARLRGRIELVGPELEWGVCHGDFSSTGNFHVAPDGIITVFDFDLCGPGWRVSDLAPIRRAAVGHKNRRIWREFLRGYTEMRPLSRADLAAVPLFYVLGRLWSMGMRAANVTRWGALFMGEWYVDWQLKVFRQWEAQRAEWNR